MLHGYSSLPEPFPEEFSMGYNHWAAIREEFENREDEQLMADWEEAVKEDQIDPKSLSRVLFYDAFRSGRYMEERRAKELARHASNRSTVRVRGPLQ
jgi:hypothetical protein